MCIAYLGVLLNQLREVVKETMLGPQEVKLIIFLTVHQVSEKLSTITSHKLGSQLHNIPGGKT